MGPLHEALLQFPTPTRRQFLQGAGIAVAGAGGAGLIGCRNKNAVQAETQQQLEARKQRIKDFVILQQQSNFHTLTPTENLSIGVGGVWASPVEETTINTSGKQEMGATVHAPADAKRILVVFTGIYPGYKPPEGAKPDAWEVFDVVEVPVNGNAARLSQPVDLKGLTSEQKMDCSFDVLILDKNGNWLRAAAPQGIHHVYKNRRPRTS